MGCIFSGIRKDREFFLYLALFTILLIFYYMFFKRYFRPRYCIYILPFFIIIIATSVNYLFYITRFFKSIPARGLAIIVVCIFLFPVFNYEKTELAISNSLSSPVSKSEGENEGEEIEGTGYFRATGEYHQNLRSTMDYLKDKIKPDDIFITTVFHPALILGLGAREENIYGFNYKNEKMYEIIEEIIYSNERGWMILDYRRHGKFIPVIYSLTDDIYINNIKLELVRNQDEAQIFQWDRKRI